MPEHLSPESLNVTNPEEQDSLRRLSRSPHPYHHQNFELPHASDRFELRNRSAQTSKHESENGDDVVSPTAYPVLPKDSPQTSDSGSEADDEHFLKGLPAPKVKLHKGLRGGNEALSGSSTPIISPAILEEEGRRGSEKFSPLEAFQDSQRVLDAVRRKKELVRRATEAGIVVALGAMVATNPQVSKLLDIWGPGMCCSNFCAVLKNPTDVHRCHIIRPYVHRLASSLSLPSYYLGIPKTTFFQTNTPRNPYALRPGSFIIPPSDHPICIFSHIHR